MKRNLSPNIRSVLLFSPVTGELREYASAYEAAKAIGVAYPSLLSALGRVGGMAGGWLVFDAPEYIRKRIADLKNELFFVEDIIALKEALNGVNQDTIIKSQREKERDVWKDLQEFYQRMGGADLSFREVASNVLASEADNGSEKAQDMVSAEMVDDETNDEGDIFCVNISEKQDAVDSQVKKMVLDLCIDDTELSVRARNCLRGMGVNTVSQLQKVRRTELMSIRNLGRKTLDEISSFLDHYLLTLEEPLEELDNEAPQEVENGREYYDFHFTMQSIHLRATMRFYPKEKRYVLLKGSGICRQSSNSLDVRSVTIRNSLLLSTSLTKSVSPELLVLLADYELPYSSCDVAVRVCSGTARLGRQAWITEDGRTFGSFRWKK